jgi:DNA gyrase subunit A
VDENTQAYISYLENEIERLRGGTRSHALREEETEKSLPAIPDEPPTTLNLITMTAGFTLKRTPRHEYGRQRRGGMGVFDLDASEADPPAVLVVADESQSILLFTDQGRAFRLNVSQISPSPVRARGQSLLERFELLPNERLAAALPDQARGGVALVTERGMVRHLRHHVFGEYMRPGVSLVDVRLMGRLVAACRTSGEGDVFIATRQGKAIRFAEKLIPPQGGPGIRLENNDLPVSITSVEDDSQVLLVDASGNGTLRPMAGFNPNKSAGGSGKLAMKTDELVAAFNVEPKEEIFLISQLSKVIRFSVDEVPAKEGVVQGVHCMTLRADQVVAGLATH